MLSNLIGLFTVLLIFRILRLNNLKTSTLLLTLAFLYDIYWVFISPRMFGESVMAVVATQIDLPMKF
jgi:signal peptide peptidase-like protein 2B